MRRRAAGGGASADINLLLTYRTISEIYNGTSIVTEILSVASSNAANSYNKSRASAARSIMCATL